MDLKAVFFEVVYGIYVI